MSQLLLLVSSLSSQVTPRASVLLLREGKGGAQRCDCSDEREAEGAAPVPQRMGRKNDLVVWLKLQPAQRKIYEVPSFLCCGVKPLSAPV